MSLLFLKYIYLYLFVCLAAPGFIDSIWDLQYSLQHHTESCSLGLFS